MVGERGSSRWEDDDIHPTRSSGSCGRRTGCSAEGADLAAVARHLEVSEATYHRWRNQYGGLKANDAKRLKELERENRRLKKIVAEKELEIDAVGEIARGNW